MTTLRTKQLTETKVRIWIEHTDPITEFSIYQYSLPVNPAVRIGSITSVGEDEGMEVDSLSIGTKYTWMAVDENSDPVTILNPTTLLIQNTKNTVQFDTVFVKTENPQIPEYKVTVKIENPIGIQAELLVLRKNPDGTSDFWCVTSPTQISELPINEPSSSTNFYRVNSYTYSTTNLVKARSFVTNLKRDLNLISLAWSKMLEFNFSTEDLVFPR